MILYVLVSGHLMGVAMTLYLHRAQTHGAVQFHPVVEHPMRFFLWFFCGVKTREWVAVHRHHHDEVETENDPHSPQVKGIWTVLLWGIALYRRDTLNVDTLSRYGKGCPNDWLERHLYGGRLNWIGSGVLLFALDFALFQWWGIVAYIIQRLWLGFWAGGVINGVGHYLGSRNFETPDASRNIFPPAIAWLQWAFAFLFVGEDLHNNHHNSQSSAKFSHRWWELDLGWLYIKLLRFWHLASGVRLAQSQRVLAT